jgi:glucose-1-phosphate thymidylyltransferase
MKKDGIILAGGTGSRLSPLTSVVNKHLLGVNGKFVIDYPLNTLKQMGVENVTVILGGNHFSQVVGYLQDGARYGMNFNYVYQAEPKGIAHAINLCKRFVCSESTQFAVVLGDNIYENPVDFGSDWDGLNAKMTLHNHPELNRFGVASLKDNKVVSLQEKPKVIDPQYDYYAVTGCYLFSHWFFEFYKDLKPSARGEYEITDILHLYNKEESLQYTFVDGLWSDAGTHESIATVNDYFFNKESK